MKKSLFLLLTTILLSSCAQQGNSSSSLPPLSDASDDSSEVIPSQPREEITYEQLFDNSNDISFKLTFKNEAIYKLAQYSRDSENNKCDMYHPADLEIILNGVSFVYEEVGVRMKGNTSRNPDFVDENGNFYAYVHYKISFKQTFDDEEDNDYYIRTWENDDLREERKDRRLGGMEKIDLKWNKNYDSTFSKQAYALDCFNDVGLLAQKSTLVNVRVNSETHSYSTTYELLECIDDLFIEKRFPEDEKDGDLYKCTYTREGQASLTTASASGSKIGKEDPSENKYPPYDLKTNKKTSDHSTLKNFINFINTEYDENDFENNVDNYLDVESYLKFEAMAYIVGGPDDHRQNSNNYYLYFSNKTNKAYFIPYDYDRCFGILKDWAIDMSDVPFTTTKKAGQDRSWQDNPLMWRMFLTHTESDFSTRYPVIEKYRNQYNDLCMQYAETYLNTNRFNSFVNNMCNAPSVNDTNEGDNQTFAYYAQTKLNITREYYNNL